jgi:hypothetical protein
MSTIDIQSNLSTAKFRQSVLEGLVNGLTISGSTTPLPVTISGSTTPIPVTLQTDSNGYKLFHHALSAASTNATVVKSSPASVGLITVHHVGNGNTNKFAKIYNKATTPTSSDIPILTLVVHPSATVVIVPAIPLFLSEGLSYRMTANYADSDNTGVAAGELAINVAYA